MEKSSMKEPICTNMSMVKAKRVRPKTMPG